MPSSEIWERAGETRMRTAPHQPPLSPGMEPMMGGRAAYGHGGTLLYDQRQPHMTTSTLPANSNVTPVTDSDVFRVSVYGWRKRCLYCFILLLAVVIVINLALTAWIMSVLDLNTNGMGALKILDDGIRVDGKAEFTKPLHFKQLSTAQGVPLTVDSSRGIYLNARNTSGQVTARLSLSHDGTVSAACDRFEIRDNDGRPLFFASKDQVGVRVDRLRIVDDGGAVFEGGVQTAIVRPEPDEPLRLESPTRGLHVDAAHDVEVLSMAGDIQVTSLLDTTIHAQQGEIRLDSPNMFIKNLQTGSATGQRQYQVCLCDTGRVFLARDTADCRADAHICN